jgi:hypothetical protein
VKLTIVGPNLLDQSKGDFHVHAAGCADLSRGQYRRRSVNKDVLEVGAEAHGGERLTAPKGAGKDIW